MLSVPDSNDTIVALGTPPGIGALGMVRISGPQAVAIVQKLWRGKHLEQVPSHTLHYGKLLEPDGEVLDEVVLGIYRAPHSYTRQNVVEISCHGSPYILNRAIELLVAAGARPAQPGELTLRAFMAGAMDLSQAEAVADLIAARSAQSRQLAMRQLRGGYSTRLHQLRDRLVNFAALVELELDFSEEDVEFADRAALQQSLQQALAEVEKLAGSFAAGNALKNGIPVAIVGKPNAGKSTLLNRLLNENRAIVSPIPGTTRDVIEDTLHLGGFEFRLMDTAGIRHTTDIVEAEGVKRSLQKTEEATIVLLLFDIGTDAFADVQQYAQTLRLQPDATLVYVANKSDTASPVAPPKEALHISALAGTGMEALTGRLVAIAKNLAGHDTVITNQRHAYALHKAADGLKAALAGLASGSSGELLAIDIRQALHYLGEITGEVTTNEILGTIFSKFCIGK